MDCSALYRHVQEEDGFARRGHQHLCLLFDGRLELGALLRPSSGHRSRMMLKHHGGAWPRRRHHEDSRRLLLLLLPHLVPMVVNSLEGTPNLA